MLHSAHCPIPKQFEEYRLIQYFASLDGFQDYSLDGFCDGWKKPLTQTQLRELIANSSYKVLAVDGEKKKIVGIITALSDNVNWAFVPYLEVLPDYQKQGIGKELMKKMLEKLSHINCIDLTCDPELQIFYEKFGMLKSVGMVVRRHLTE